MIKREHITVNHKRIQDERQFRILDKKLSDNVSRLQKQGMMHTSVPSFVKNGSVDYSVKSIVMATNAEMSKFKQTPIPKIESKAGRYTSMD